MLFFNVKIDLRTKLKFNPQGDTYPTLILSNIPRKVGGSIAWKHIYNFVLKMKFKRKPQFS